MNKLEYSTLIQLKSLNYNIIDNTSDRINFLKDIKNYKDIINYRPYYAEDIILDDEYKIEEKESSQSLMSFIPEITPLDDPFYKIRTVDESILKDNSRKIITKEEKENIQLEMKNKIYLKKPFKEIKKFGRKRKSDEGLGEHNKYSDDNIIRKIKKAVLNNTMEYINEKIFEIYSDICKSSLKEKRLLKMKQGAYEKGRANYNKSFLNQSLKLLFSEEISTKYTKHSPQHNKNTIEMLINEEDVDKRSAFLKLFSLTFRDCLNHFRGTAYIEELDGMIIFEEYCKILGLNGNEDKYKYKKLLEYFLMNYEELIMAKKQRNLRKEKKNNKINKYN